MNATRAEVCVVACAEAWRGDGAILASAMGVIPSLGARLARLTFEPGLLLTDGEAYLLDADDQVEGWLPYAKVFTMLAAGLRLIVARRVPVASFAQAPKPELIAALKDAGMVTIASAGARRHAEKAAMWASTR